RSLRDMPEVDHTIGVVGRSILADAVAPFYGFQIPVLKPWGERAASADAIIARVQKEFRHDPDGKVRVVNPSPLPGL
ncbi:hypothetical protein INQ07_26665, partial [Escherichia coli]|nr:hypothetical protein [Escherichia coli]